MYKEGTVKLVTIPLRPEVDKMLTEIAGHECFQDFGRKRKKTAMAKQILESGIINVYRNLFGETNNAEDGKDSRNSEDAD